MKDVLKTLNVTGTILLICLLVFVISGNVKNKVEMLSRNDLSLTDPTIAILSERIVGEDYLRKSNLVPSELSNKELIEYVFTKITKEDYTTKKMEPVKIRCEINDNLYLTSSTTCNVLIIKNETINSYISRFFNIERELEYPNINFRGYTCKNDGKNYYCLYEKYKPNVLSYSILKDAHEDKDRVYVREYYLYINMNNHDRCLKYFDSVYCESGDLSNKPEIDESIIKNDGVLYEHVFVRVDNSLYLEKSYIVSER